MVKPVLSFSPSRVLTTTEAREAAPALAQRFHEEGVEAGIVFYGPHRRPDAAIVPAALLEALAPYLEDLAVANEVRRRREEDTGERLSLAELDAKHGFTPEAVADEAAALRRELGLQS
jgi:hypothetical protein